MFTSIGTALYNILNGLIATTTLNAVFNYDIKTVDSFPCASISIQEGEEQYLDQLVNQAILKYKIRVYDQNRSVELMESRMRLLIDNIMIELRKKQNCTLGGVAQRMTFSFNWGWQNDEQSMRVCEINCDILTTELI